jgi:hypothetical protein
VLFTRAYGFLGTTIAVDSDQSAVLDWLDEFLTPAFDRCDGAVGDVNVAIRTDGATYQAMLATRPPGELPTAPCFSLDQRVTRRPQWAVGGHIVVADDKFDACYVLTNTRVEILAARGSLRFRTGAMRVIGELAAARSMADVRRLQMHAAALEVAGSGLLLAGPKTSGKTTLLAHLAASTGAAVLANDRSVLCFSPTGIEMRAIPMNVKVRPWTIERMPGLFPTRAPVPLQALLTLAEVAAATGSDCAGEPDGEIKLSPAQLAQTLGVSLAARSRLAVVAFPDHHADPSGVAIARLSPAEAEPRLLQARFGVHSAKTEPTVFERFTASARADGADEALIHELAAAVPCFAVTIGARAYGQAETAARILTELLAAEPFSRGVAPQETRAARR